MNPIKTYYSLEEAMKGRQIVILSIYDCDIDSDILEECKEGELPDVGFRIDCFVCKN